MQRVNLQEILMCPLGPIKSELGLTSLFTDDPAGRKQTPCLKTLSVLSLCMLGRVWVSHC